MVIRVWTFRILNGTPVTSPYTIQIRFCFYFYRVSVITYSLECAPEDAYQKIYTSNIKRVYVKGNLNPDSGTNQANCPTPIQLQGWDYTDEPADC